MQVAVNVSFIRSYSYNQMLKRNCSWNGGSGKKLFSKQVSF